MISQISKSLPLSYSLIYWGISARSICLPTRPGLSPWIASPCSVDKWGQRKRCR
jgi:hypothetical protein